LPGLDPAFERLVPASARPGPNIRTTSLGHHDHHPPGRARWTSIDEEASMRAEVVLVVSLTALTPSHPAAAADAAPAAATRFTSSRPGEILVSATVGAKGPFRFLLDTGSTHTAVTDRLATAVDAVPVARTVMRAAAGSIRCLVVALPAVVVDGVSADGLTATALPRAAAAALGPGVDGVLGQDFLSRFAFTIDYRRSRIVWHDADYVAPGTRLALVPAQNRWLVELPQPATAPGIPPTMRRFVPDSGADTLVLFGERRAGCLITAWQAGTSALGSLSGERAVRTATVDGLRVGEATLDRQIAAVVPSIAPDDPDGLLPLHLFASVFFSARSRALVIQAR
jgi:predicted aspartyl protease